MAIIPSSPQKLVGRTQQSSALPMGGYSDTGWLSTLNGRALVVCRIDLGENRGGGTGFLIGKDLIMTNNHVISTLEAARTAKAHFFYTIGSVSVEIGLNPDHFFYTSPTPNQLGFKPITKDKLDYTIVSIHPHPKIHEVSHLAFSIFGVPTLETEIKANIIHHPLDTDGTAFQKVSFRENLVKEVSLYTIHYTTTTLPGSSGAPVIDDEGNLIALHRATCTHILKALLKEKMLTALLQELFPDVVFISQTLTLMEAQSKQEMKFTGLCATIDGSPLYIFSEGELKGQYFYQGKTASLFRLIATKHTPAKEWALQFLNSRLEEPLAEYHKECNTAVPIKAIHDHLKNANLLAQIQACYEESQKSLSNLLKESYLQTCASLSLLLTNAAFPTESFFTQLSIVSHTSQEKKEEEARQRDPHLVEKDSLREIYARLCTTEKPIEINNLFDSQESKPIKRVLVLGRAGIGKSTLCQKIAYDWASGTLFNQKFALVYHIKLRDFNSQKKFSGEWLSLMIAETCYGGAHQEKILQELQTHPEKILLILDGWDEASPELTQALENYFLQTQVHYILTSRPGVTSKIHGNFDLIVENMGFSRTQIETYIEKFFTHTQCTGKDLFLKMLSSRSNLLTIAHIPIQLQILCALWQKGEQEFPQTLTPLFSKIVHHLFEWEQNKNLQKEKLTPLKHLFLYQALGEVALRGLESKQLIISPKLVEGTLIEKSLENSHFENINRQDLIDTGLVKVCGVNNEIYFLHLTYQEYSIAHYISSLPKSSLDKKLAQERQRIFVQTYRYQPHFHLVIRMLAGCMWEDYKNVSIMETFFGWLYEGHTDLIGTYQTELVLSCLDECQSVELEKKIWEKYKIRDFVESILERKTIREYLSRLMALSGLIFKQVVQHLEKMGTQQTGFLCWFFEKLNQYSNEERIPEILNLIQMALSHESREVRRTAANALGQLAAHTGKENFPQILNEIQKALSGQDGDMREAAADAFRQLAAHAGKEHIPQILNEIQKALSGQDGNVRRSVAEDVRRAAANALGQLATHAGKENIPHILNEIQTALSHRDEVVHHATANALRHLAAHAGKENIPQVLNWILTALSGQDWVISRAAANALGHLAAHAGKENIPQILNGIQTALCHQHWELRMAAANALRHLAAHARKENFPQILKGIQTALSDRDDDVRKVAANGLEELAAHAEKEYIPQILNEIQKALNDQGEGVRKAAVGALENLAAHAGNKNIPQILTGIQTALNHQDWEVRKTAVGALENLAAHAGNKNIPHILTGIQTALNHQGWYMRDAALRALRNLAAHAGNKNIPQILNWIQTALKDQNWQVRGSAVIALGQLATYAEKENIPEILNELLTALKDQNEGVRETTIQTTCGLKTKWLLPIFTSQPVSHPTLIPIIFDHFINQSIPLYFIENSSSIHTSDTCYEAFNPQQLSLLLNRCAALFTQTWTDSTEFDNAQEPYTFM